MKCQAKIFKIDYLLALFLVVLISFATCAPVQAYAIDDVKDCVNPKHYGVKRTSDIKDKAHEGDLNDECYTQEERDEKVKQEYNSWLEAVKTANVEYTKKYNVYENALNQKFQIQA